MLNNKNVLKICSIVIAICLWVYVIGEVDPESRKKISDIEVNYVNTEVLAEKGLAASEEETIVISAIVEGKRSDVNDAKKRGITAMADVSKCEKGKNRVDIIVNLPDGVKLDSLSEDTTEVNVYDKVSEEKNVKIGFSKKAKEQDSVPWVMKSTPETVVVSGAENRVAQISYVKGIIDTDEVGRNVKNLEVKLTPVDSKGEVVSGIELSYEVAYVDVQLLSYKTVKLDVKTENLADGLTAESVEAAKEVRIVGTTGVLKGIDKLEGIADLSEMAESGKVRVTLNLPEGVYLYDGEGVTEAKVTLKPAQ